MISKSKIIALISFYFLIFSSIQIYAQLRSPNNQADYIIIYHPDFQNQLSNFIQWRQSKGLTVLPVNINDVYREFNDTASQQESIREFISYTLNNWHEPKPQYLLLVGSILHLPTYKVESEFNGQPDLNEDSVSIDEFFVTNKYDGDNTADMCIGRFPARTIDELNNMINKTIQFEDHFNEIEYKYDFLALSDSSDQSYFTILIENLIGKNLPKSYNIKRIYFQDTSQYKSSKEDLFTALNEGASIMCFYGHANPYIWIRNGIYYSEDFDTSINSNKPFFLTAATSFQSFDNPDKKSIIEKLITNNPGGAVATLAPSGLTFLSPMAQFFEGFFNRQINNKNLTIGKAIMETKRNSSSSFNNIKQFTLLGDPALKFPEKLIASIKEIFSPKSKFGLNVFPNPFNNKINVSFNLTDNIDVELMIYDLKGNLISENCVSNQGAGLQNIDINLNDISAGEYYCVLKVGNEIELNKIVCVK